MPEKRAEIAKLLMETLKNPPTEVLETFVQVQRRTLEGLNGSGPDYRFDRMTV